MFEDIIVKENEGCLSCKSAYDYLDVDEIPNRCPECGKSPQCPCGGHINDWHSHASDCIIVNKEGRKY